jgi:hypothetical protein
MLLGGIVGIAQAIRLFIARGEVLFLIVPAGALIYLAIGTRLVVLRLERDPEGWRSLTQPKEGIHEAPKRRSFFEPRDLPALLLIWLAPVVGIPFGLADVDRGAFPRLSRILGMILLGVPGSIIADE